jgi:hypothetical protein
MNERGRRDLKGRKMEKWRKKGEVMADVRTRTKKRNRRRKAG